MAANLVLVVDGVASGLLLFCVAAGLTVLFGVFGVFNMAHGTGCLIGAYIAATTFPHGLLGLAVGVAAATAGGLLFGAVLQLLLAPLSDRPMQQSLATLGIAAIVGDLLTERFGALPLRVDAPGRLGGSVTVAGEVYPLWRLLFIAAAVLLAVGLFVTVNRTRAGAVVRAVAADPAMAAACGINPRAVRWAVFAVAGALTVSIGALGAPILGAAPGVDEQLLLQSLVVVVVGGLGSIRGALLASLGVGVLTPFAAMFASGLSPLLLTGALLLALAVRRTQPATARTDPDNGTADLFRPVRPTAARLDGAEGARS
ncbi:branched-chain amino acid ABC transporter permease [Dactylosporangium sp. NPDC051485]|uniref:branched-chain amino acid ABC transporter permease n=1 Tax=Dactylosporangium sp. NPDC051485 TaxID=3154846 RepID=UPI003444F1B6